MNKNEKSPSWENLTFANNFLFCKILESERELCRRLLEILLGMEIERLEPVQSEKTMLETLDSKSVRFDVYTRDDKRIFDIEMQTSARKDLSKRARYYQSVIDMDNLSGGENYSSLKDSYIIFLCLEDPFSKELPVYFFENTCRDDSTIKLNDCAYKLFFNAGKYDKMESDEAKKLFKFISGLGAESELTKSIEEKVNFAKKNMGWRKQYMTWQQTIDEEKELAFEDGKEAKAVEDAENLLREGLPPEMIARCIRLPLERVMQIAETIPAESIPKKAVLTSI